ncbi:glycosyltransferase [Cobetia sp. 14N.309.X.WAT.E.A4]|uniref:glycosyltransferase n=1 Tax=Cobetia sp. 14N.309.X.WAT.E.A4 TaxID=2998323 RepID=UPI0025B090A8|nr:glycosyltransferase [Cobetia sp. 14N.309.X.WAT.E.A4]MDN2658005.1 glycosyltransferase [Cobetia sp. 14N.309.X.WAT.E.A4]
MQIVPSLYNAGGEIFSVQLSIALAELGHEVKLVSIAEVNEDNYLLKQILRSEIQFESLKKKNGSGINMSIPFRLVNIVKNWKPDIIHTHLRALPYSIFLTKYKSKKFHTVHNVADKESGSKVRLLNKLLFKLGWCPVAISPIVGNSIQDIYKISAPIVSNGVVRPIVTVHKAEFLKHLNIDSNNKIITHIGRLIDTKNQLLLIEVFERIAKYDKNVYLFLVGNDPVRGEPYLNKLNQSISSMEPHISKRIKLLGSRSDIGNILQATDVFVLCSKYEGLPLSLLEALSHGLRCVCTDVGGISDALSNDIGWLVESDKSYQLEEAINEALAEQDEEYSEDIKHHFDNLFSIKKCARGYELLYKN